MFKDSLACIWKFVESNLVCTVCWECGMFRMWDAWAVRCSKCGIVGMSDVGCRMLAGMWDVDLKNACIQTLI